MRNIVLVGQQNCGKTSLFNKLTGLNQKVGNFAGVTVEKKTGIFMGHTIVDIPGLRSLDTNSPEEHVSKTQILNLKAESDLVLFACNGMQLSKGLMLYSQIADLQIPVVFVINFIDEMLENNIEIDKEKIEKYLGCPLVLMNSKTGQGQKDLEEVIKYKKYCVPNAVNRSSFEVYKHGMFCNTFVSSLDKGFANEIKNADYGHRLRFAARVVKDFVTTENAQKYLSSTKRLDNILLHPIYGVLIFLAVMYAVFQSVFFLSGFPMDWIDQSFAWMSETVKNVMPDSWMKDLVSDAIIPGVGGVVIFIPQIAILFFLLSLLEHSGYLSRISYLSDAVLRKFGLSGHSIMPLMSSWACAIPAIMSTRIIANPRERMAVIMASPLMTCSARLPVYAVMIAILFSDDTSGISGLILLGLYLLGLVATLIVALIVSKNSSKSESESYWILELPVFRLPNWRNIFITVYQKTKSFVLGAGKIIFTISILLWVLLTFSPLSSSELAEIQKQEEAIYGNTVTEASVQLEYSYLGHLGKFIEPTIQPLGYDWKIGIGLLASFAAREVFVGTLATIYSVESEEEATIVERMKKETVKGTSEPRFGWATSISLLLFYVFAMQCMSTLAIVKRETGSWKYPLIQFVFMTALAYLSALLAYKLLI